MRTINLVALAMFVAAPAALAQSPSAMALRHEHDEIEQALTAATRESGAVGKAAIELNEVLQPHFAREQQLIIPHLGLAARLVEIHDVQGLNWLPPLTETLQRQLPRMIKDHELIAAKTANLKQAGERTGNRRAVKLAMQLASHAGEEEASIYPLAVLIGEIVRMRME